MDEQEDSKIVTLKEIIAEENSLQEEAEYQSQFDWGKEDVCTYDQGYIRQPLYGCKTCKDSSEQQFGFCYGCSMTCHIEHDVFEMFDKRDFRCDCGTPKSGCECSFRGKVEENNKENVYTHNFDHKYCFCDGSYDPEKDVMYQCVMCLDWFHILCIENRQLENAPETEVKCDYICDVCTGKNPYLGQYYSELKLPKTAYTNPVDQVTDQPQEKVEEKIEIDTKGETGCVFKFLQKKYEVMGPVKNTFWKKGWTNALCRCEECLALYKSHNTSYLVESEIDFDRTPEPINNEEEEGQDPAESTSKASLVDTIKNGERVFLEAPIPHTQKIDMLMAYQSLESGLKDYLKDFAEKGKVVTKRDIEDFFEKFQDNKRRKF